MARIDKLESDLEKSRIDFEKASEEQKNAAFGVSPDGRDYSDEDYAVAKAQKKVIELRFEVERDQAEQRAAGDTQPKASAVQRATLLRQAKKELSEARHAQIATELNRAKRDFDDASQKYESAKQGGDEKEIETARSFLAEVSRRLEQTTDDYDRFNQQRDQAGHDDVTFEIDFNVAKARKKISELNIQLETAKTFGDGKTVEKTTRDIEIAKNELAEAEYSKIMQELGNATCVFEDAAKKYDSVKNTGDSDAVSAAQEVLEKAAKRLEDANSGYVSFMNQADKTNKDVEQRVFTAGTFSAFAVRGLEGGGTLERVAKATEETAKNTKQLLKQSKQSTALSFG